jgi:hypothetical protein
VRSLQCPSLVVLAPPGVLEPSTNYCRLTHASNSRTSRAALGLRHAARTAAVEIETTQGNSFTEASHGDLSSVTQGKTSFVY